MFNDDGEECKIINIPASDDRRLFADQISLSDRDISGFEYIAVIVQNIIIISLKRIVYFFNIINVLDMYVLIVYLKYLWLF